MKHLFMTYLDAGLLGSVIILVGLFLRPIFRKVPRRILCIVWLLAAIRLLLPFNIESQFSLQPSYEPLVNLRQEQHHQPVFTPPAVLPDLEVPDVNPEPDFPPQDIPVIPETPVLSPGTISKPLDFKQLLSVVWVSGIACILMYCIISYIVLKRRIRTAVPCENGVMESEYISGAFLLGYVKPKIYLPLDLKEQDRAFILSHERIHIQRLDHWWKLVGVLCVAIHWYNPLVWIGYALLCRDIEITCDEQVIQSMDIQERKAYSQALLNSEKRRFGILDCPVAFGEVDIKQRIRNVLAYHPYGYWLTVVAVALVAFVAFCFLTSPVTEPEQDPTQDILSTQPTDPTMTEPTVTVPVTTDPTVTEPITTNPPVTQPPETEPPVTEPPVTEPPVTEPPVTEPPVTEPPITVIARGSDSYNKRSFQVTSDGTLTLYGFTEHADYGRLSWDKYADLITRIVITEGCVEIPYESFRDFDNLREVYLCESLQTIGDMAFHDCDNLQYIRIPANVTTIGSHAFARCLALTKVDFAPDSKLTKIGSSAFGHTAITSFTAPPKLKTIDDYAFSGCWRLKTVILKGSIEEVRFGAFCSCTRLEHVVLGETLVRAEPIFRECGEIKTVENYSKFPFEDFL